MMAVVRMWVYFEKKGLKSALVKPENLHIAFEYPSNNSRYVHMNKLKVWCTPMWVKND